MEFVSLQVDEYGQERLIYMIAWPYVKYPARPRASNMAMSADILCVGPIYKQFARKGQAPCCCCFSSRKFPAFVSPIFFSTPWARRIPRLRPWGHHRCHPCQQRGAQIPLVCARQIFAARAISWLRPPAAISLDGYCQFSPPARRPKLIAGQGFAALKRCIAKAQQLPFARWAAFRQSVRISASSNPALQPRRLPLAKACLAVCGAQNVFNPGKKLKMAKKSFKALCHFPVSRIRKIMEKRSGSVIGIQVNTHGQDRKP